LTFQKILHDIIEIYEPRREKGWVLQHQKRKEKKRHGFIQLNTQNGNSLGSFVESD
jgi:hypothetical protein